MIYQKQGSARPKYTPTIDSTTPHKFQRTQETTRNGSLTRNRSAISLEHQKFIKETELTESRLDPDRFFRNIHILPGKDYPSYLKPEAKGKDSPSHKIVEVRQVTPRVREISQLQLENASLK